MVGFDADRVLLSMEITPYVREARCRTVLGVKSYHVRRFIPVLCGTRNRVFLVLCGTGNVLMVEFHGHGTTKS